MLKKRNSQLPAIAFNLIDGPLKRDFRRASTLKPYTYPLIYPTSVTMKDRRLSVYDSCRAMPNRNGARPSFLSLPGALLHRASKPFQSSTTVAYAHRSRKLGHD
ncbi:hypothetical protein QCA50_004528 [Cerrena zonata]|uniref:Uncharacterized protein n=1 Tax=Cerrena zonata TaxID=2478898 RepID=A0AAW0GH13_9APHY